MLCISTGFASLCRGQDQISNGSFEDSWGPLIEWAQFRYATNWHSNGELYTPAEEHVWGHSPDYFDDLTPFSPISDPNVGMRTGVAPIGVTAHSGHRFAGLDDYELIQQEYGNNNLQERRFYTVSMFIRPSSYYFDGTSNLRIFLANNEFDYQNTNNNVSDVCTSDYMSYDPPTHVKELASIPISLDNYPADRWSRVSTTFYVSEDLNETFKWLVIDMNSGGNAQACGQHYIFVDDVSFVRAEYCSSACAPDLDATSNGTVQNVMLADAFCPGPPNCGVCWQNRYTGTCEPPVNEFEPTAYDYWCCPVKFFEMQIWNAVGINFWVRSRWGANDIVYERHEFDANGLKFADQEYFVLQWMGRNNAGQHLPSGMYDYELEYWNCDPGSQQAIESSLYYEVGDEWYDQPAEVLNGILESCCPDHLYFQNYTFSGLVLENASTFITAGSNVTSGTPGPVIVPYTSNVTFHAGEEINLEPGFIVEPGAEFHAVISDCVYGEPKSMQYRPEFSLSSMASWGKPAEELVALFPNPTKGPFNVKLPEGNERGEIRVSDPTGKVVRIFKVQSPLQEFDMSGLARGIYFLEVYGQDGFLQSFRLAYE